MDKKVDRNFLIAVIMVSIFPVFGYIWSLIKINRNNAKLMLLVICIFDFFLALRVPPYQDLFRRYTETYYSYFPNINIFEALENKLDFLFYINSWLFYKASIPFFYIPAIYSALTIYNVYSSYLLMANKSNICGRFHNNRKFLISSLIVISTVNIVGIATTLRFGFAASLMIKSIVIFFTGKKKNSLIYMVLGVLMHASMVIPIGALIVSKFIRLRRVTTLILSIMALGFSVALIKYVLTHFDLFGLSSYFMVGYVDSVWSSFSTDLSTLFFITVQYIVIIFLFSQTMYKSKDVPGLDNFINVFIVICFLLTISITVFNRFFIGMASILLLFRYLTSERYFYCNWLVKYFLLGLIFYNFIFINIYVQRRPILLGQMYTALYTPPIMNAFYTMKNFNDYLKKVNADGDWIGHELGK